MDFIISKIKSNMISAIGSTNTKTALQYLFWPQIHIDLDGKPVAIVGNMSDEQGEFSLGKVSLKAIAYFILVDLKNELPTEIAMPDKIRTEFLKDTDDWVDMAGLQGCAVNNWFVLFQGMEPIWAT